MNCVICGARTEYAKASTCSPFCTDAKRRGITYAQAIKESGTWMQEHEWQNAPPKWLADWLYHGKTEIE